jgi:hypothetical protein
MWYALKGFDCFNSTNSSTMKWATIVQSIAIVSGNRFFREWKEKMNYGRCVTGRQSIMAIPTCVIPIKFGLITFQLNQCFPTTEYCTTFTLCDHTID